MDILDSSRQLFGQFRSDPLSTDIFSALSGALFFVAFVSWSIEHAALQHWSLGLCLTAGFGALLVWIARQAASFDRTHQISMVLLFFVLSVLLGAVLFSGISYICHREGWAHYSVPQQVTMQTFRHYYFWTFMDMVPAIDVWKAFPVKPPVEPIDSVAGAPVFAFRMFMLVFVFANIRRWWELYGRRDAVASKTGRE